MKTLLTKNTSFFKKLSFLIFTSSINFTYGQISTTKVAEPKLETIEPYDSLKNFLGADFKKYVGQQFYLIPLAETLREYGYSNFILDINKSSYDKSNTFKCCDSYNSKYDELQGKYFSVLEAIEDPKSSISSDGYLKLKINETNEVVYFKYNKKYEHNFPFLVVGYYEKHKDLFVGNDVLIRPFPKIEGLNQKKTTDISTGEEVVFNTGEFVKCIEITIDEKYYEPSLLLENNKGQKFLFSLDSRFLNICRIYLKEEVDQLLNKFGEENWNTILEENIKIGFTEEMTKTSWGEPDKINRSSYGDQWVYGNQYLYFENGILKSFN